MLTIIKHFFLGLLILGTISIHAQKSTIIDHNLQCINCDKPQDSSTVLEVQSTNRGVSLPSMNSNKRMNIANPIDGLIVYDIDTHSFWYYENTHWTELGSSSSNPITAPSFGVSTVQDKKKLLPSDVPDAFGVDVSISGNMAIIGTPYDDVNGYGSGSAYIFTRIANNWTQTAKLTPTDGDINELFGSSVAVSGNTAIVGAYQDDIFGNNSGSAYIFSFDGTNWTQTTKLLPLNGATGDWFGYDVAIDGNNAIISAHYDDETANNSGSAYIFSFDGINWIQTAKLLANDGDSSDWFGRNVAIDGNNVIIGASYDDDNGSFSGSAYIFSFNGNWTQTAKLLANDGASGDTFGSDVAISGNTVIIGAPYDFDNGANSGSAYIFSFNGNWTQTAKLLAEDGDIDDAFGNVVAIDGNTAIIGIVADEENGEYSGSACIFSFDGINWVQTAKLLAHDGNEDDSLGRSVSIDGNTIIIGASGDDDNFSSGSAYIY